MRSGEPTSKPRATETARRAGTVRLAQVAAGAVVIGCGLWLSNALPQDRVPTSQFPPIEIPPVEMPDATGRVQITHGHTSTLHVQEEQRVRINYILAPWQSVLEDFAEATGTDLVATEFPAGRYSRQDWNWYDRAEGFEILKCELDKSGFDLRFEENLLVLRRRQVEARADYLRTHLDEPPAEIVPAGAQEERSTGYTRQFDSIMPVAPQSRPTNPRVIHDPFVTPVAYLDDASSGTEETAASETEPTVSATYQATHRTALDLARSLYDTYRVRAELVEAGPLGFPAFQVLEIVEETAAAEPAPGVHPMLAPERPAWLTVEIDSDGNKLHMHGQQRTLDGLDQLLRILDRPQRPGEQQPRVILGDEKMTRIGEQLGPQIERLRQSRQSREEDDVAPTVITSPDADPFAANPILAYQDDAAQPNATQQDPNQPADQGEGLEDPAVNDGFADPNELLAPLENVGDVRIETINDLNLMIIYGNEADIEAVMRVIRTLDELAVGASPGIDLLYLNYVNCEALAELLNEVYSGIDEVTQPTGQTQPTITIVPVVTPNAILILAPRSHINDVLALAEQLDREGDPQMEVQVFPLENAVVSQVMTMLDTFYAERGGLAPRILAVPDVRTNNLIVQARPRDLAEVAEIILRIDRDESPAVARLRVIRLQNSLADEVAEFLNTTFQSILNPATSTTGQGVNIAGGQGAQELRDSKAMVLEFLSSEGNAERLLRSGLLSDVRFNADIRTNNLLVTAPEASMPLIEAIVTTLDMPSAAVADIKVFQLENADAVSAADLLVELFQTDAQEEDAIQFQLPGSLDASSTLIPIRFTVDARTNSVIAFGGADAMRVVEAILIRLDASELRNRQSRVIKLRNSPAASVADALNLFLEQQRAIAQLDPERFSISELLEREVIVVPDPVTNNILVDASPRYFEEIVNMALQLDAAPPQVMIQALIVEVDLADTDEFGVELGFQDPLLFDRSVLDAPLTISETVTLPNGTQTTSQRIISQTATPGFNFNNQPLGNNIGINPSSVGTQGLSNFALGRVNGDLGFGGLVLSASSESVSVLIRALAAHRNLRVHSRPQVSALDNIGAQIQVGQVVPVVNGVSFNNNQTIPIVEQQDSGIILTVQPRISPEGDVVMQFAAEKSKFQTDGVPLFTDAATGNVITSPIKDIITASTTIVGSSRVDLQACKLEYSIVSPK